MTKSQSGVYLWGLIGTLGPQVIYLLTNIWLARLLSPQDFGTIGVLSIFIAVANVLIDTGLGGSLIKEETLRKEDCSTISVFNISVSILIYILIFFLSPLVEQFYQIDGLTEVARLLCLIFVMNSFGLVPRCILMRKLEFSLIGIISLLSVVIASICSIVGAYRGMGVYALVLYQLVHMGLASVGYYVASRYKLSLRFYKESFRRLFSFGVYTTVANIIESLYNNLLTMLTGKFAGVNQAGYVSQSYKLQDVSTNGLITGINNVAFPILTRVREDIHRFREEGKRLMSSVSLLLSPMFVFVSVFSKEIIALLLGEQWLAAAPYLSVLMIASLFIIIDKMISNFFKSLLKVEKLLRISIVQRVIGILIVTLFAVIDSSLIVYGFLLGSILSLLINSYAYSKEVSSNFMGVIGSVLRSWLPSILLWLILFVVYSHSEAIWYALGVALIAFAMYYFLLLPKFYSINIISLAKELLVKKK